MVARMFTMRITTPDNGHELMCCIPMQDDFAGEERVEFAETSVLCIYYRGAYEGIGAAIAVMNDYVEENHIRTTGPYRSIYLEGPPSRGTHTSDYITQIVVPI